MATVYLLIFPNGKGYVGQTRGSVKARYTGHRWAAKNTPKDCRILYRAWRKYGDPQLLVLSICRADQLSQTERNCIALLGTQTPGGYNITDGGEGTAHTIESRKRISRARTGMKFTDAHRTALRKSHEGHRPSDASKAKRAESMRKAYTPELRALRAAQMRARWAKDSLVIHQ